MISTRKGKMLNVFLQALLAKPCLQMGGGVKKHFICEVPGGIHIWDCSKYTVYGMLSFIPKYMNKSKQSC